jgi:hypothetical protein
MGDGMGNSGGASRQPKQQPMPTDDQIDHLLELYPDGLTVEDIGTVMGCSRERTFQLLRKALEKCRMVCARRGVTMADLPRQPWTVWDELGS